MRDLNSHFKFLVKNWALPIFLKKITTLSISSSRDMCTRLGRFYADNTGALLSLSFCLAIYCTLGNVIIGNLSCMYSLEEDLTISFLLSLWKSLQDISHYSYREFAVEVNFNHKFFKKDKLTKFGSKSVWSCLLQLATLMIYKIIHEYYLKKS